MSLNNHELFMQEVTAASERDLIIAKTIANKIKTFLGNELQKVILFGSRARGDHQEDSDYDFIVIADFKESSWVERAKKIRKFVNATREFNVDAEYIPVTEWEFENKVLFRKSVKKEGVVLYESGHTRVDVQS
ncbi:nucleotidyltransferase domain-containing protein [Paenibacillus alginolyticus]|uniref:nucleotidyltransferase domain-containing protein n=1 Tax=Paenibacillus alginolyticus TaxID=59839 RepID=UPI000413F300|nr:nucleotidyltransferase domain-containing protein [Paenibacillus alginolyticus]MCY9666263.1 nucleotidyltransferase domain-containing protein [Paenibacillus alginolyticus]